MEFKKLIKEICVEENIKYDLVSEEWVMVLTKNDATRCIFGYRFNLNDHALGSVIDDKFAFYDLCKLKGIPIIEHKILFNPNCNFGIHTPSLLEKYFSEYEKNVVVKPNLGYEGIDVLHITDLETLKLETEKLFRTNFSISICPFYNIESEYRVIVLNAKVKLIFEKVKPVIVGDGKRTIKELLRELNPYYFENKDLDEGYNRVLEKEEKFEYDWRFNLSRGATAKKVEDKKTIAELSKFAIDVCQKLEAKFVSVDIIKCNNNLSLMEINSGVSINKVCNFIDQDLKITKEIYREAVLSMFQEK